MLTLTTDWEQKDYYFAVFKAFLHSKLPDLNIIEISENIEKFNKLQAAFLLKNSYPFFPKGTVHVVSVWNNTSSQSKVVIASAKNQFFIGPDNGIIYQVLEDIQADFFYLKEAFASTFPALEIYAPIAVHLLNKKPLEQIANPTSKIQKMIPFIPMIEENIIKGQIIYIDSFGNAITNISFNLFNEQRQKRVFTIFPGTEYYKITQISESYSDVPGGELVAVFNTLGYLELAINEGSLANLVNNIEINTVIKIEFYDN